MSVFGVILVRIQLKCGKIRTRITPNSDKNSCLTDKTLKDYKMTLIEIEKVVSDERELMNIFNTFQILFQK